MTTVTRVPVPDLCCLWAETDTTPMIIALVGTVDAGGLVDEHGEVALDRIRSLVAARLDRAPMLRRVLRHTGPGQGRDVWVDATDFSVDDHVVAAAPGRVVGDEQGFLDWCARASLRPLDRSRPLWRMTLVTGLPDGRLGVLVAVHHVVADGLRGVAMIAGLLDVDPGGRSTAVEPWRPAPPPTAAELVADNLRTRVRAVRSIRASQLRARLVALRGLRAEVASRAPDTVLTGPIGPGRRLVVVRQPLEELRTAGHRLGCTVNDLLLAAVTGGLRQMLGPAHLSPTTMLRATVPVGETNGHRSGMIAVTLPVGMPDPRERLRHIVAETSYRKQSPDDGVAGIVSLPASLARLGVLWARHNGAAHINLYVTNVPGPPVPLYLAGARLHDVVPLAPLVAGVRLSVTALSYDGVLSVALLGDEALTDFAAFAGGVRAGFKTYLTLADPARHVRAG